MTAIRRVRPARGPLDAIVRVPGSKSVANRALVCAALADGESRLHGVPDGDDTRALIDGLAELGFVVGGAEGDVVVQGAGGEIPRPGGTVDAGLAGTTARFLTAVAALGREPTVVDGHGPLRQRPMAGLHDALGALGAHVAWTERVGHLPVVVARAGLAGGRVALPGDVSSQFVTALMLIGPVLDGGLVIDLTSPLVSRPYVAITAAVMAAFGIGGVEVGDRAVVVPPGSYRACEYVVEPDASSASYPLAAAALCGGRVTVEGLGTASLQGDAGFADLLAAMGCRVERGRATTVERGGHLAGIDVDLRDMSDLVPTVAAVATLADSPSRLRGVGFVRAKESDRIGDLAAELRRLGAGVDERDDGLVVHGGGGLHGARVATHHDHRLAMAAGILGLAVPGVEVEDPDVVTKSWPGFWRMLDALAMPSP